MAKAAAAASTLQELLEEAKRRTVLFVLVVLMVSYCMSLTSNSVLINVPIAIVLLAVARRISLELVIRWRPSSTPEVISGYEYKRIPRRDLLLSSDPTPSTKWRSKIDSPGVEAAVEEFTHKIVAEFVTDLWYSSVTPDREVPQEIENIINGAIGEVSLRAKQVNLITLLTRDIVNVIASHLELYRELQSSIGADYLALLSSEEKEEKIKESLVSAKKLHPAVSSVKMEIQVLQRLMDGVLAIVLRPEEANCKIVRCFSRELLACAVMRQIMNFACPRFINEIIEWVIISSRSRLSQKTSVKAQAEIPRSDFSSQVTESFAVPKETDSGVEMAEVGRIEEDDNRKGSTATSSLKSNAVKSNSSQHVYTARSGDWAHALDAFNQRKTQALAPEHLDNLWAKGRNYKRRDAKKTLTKVGEPEQSIVVEDSPREGMSELREMRDTSVLLDKTKMPVTVDNDYYGKPRNQSRIIVVGEDSIGVRSGTCSKEPSVSRVIHHPLEDPEAFHEENTQKTHHHRRSHSSGGMDHDKYTDMTKKPPPAGVSGYKSKLSCKVLGAHYEKTGSKSFAVYSISVSNMDENTWVVLRRYRNFEQLHRRLRDMPHYTLSVPPKRFLSSNLDNSFVRERCILLNKYLKDLLSIPSIAELHEVWDFLSAKSRNYAFGESVSIMKTLAVNVDDAVDDVFRQIKGVSEGVLGTAGSKKSSQPSVANVSSHTWNPSTTYIVADAGTHSQASDEDGEDGFEAGWHSDSEVQNVQHNFRLEASFSDGHSPVESLAGSEMNEEPEWNPPKLTTPLLNLVDMIFQLEGRGWIRRQILWIAKQVLQLGMADAIDDWLLTQVQYLRSEEVIVSSIKFIEQLLWRDGVFIIKHPKFQLSADNQAGPQISFEDQLEAARRKMVVRELLQDQAPSALVSLIGRKQYMRCAKDIYGFLQSDVCIKQLAYSLLEKLLGAAFPELEDLILEVSSPA